MTVIDNVDTLGYGDFAIALYASSLTCPADVADLPRYAEEGMTILGGYAVVRTLHDHWLRLNTDRMYGRLDDAEYARRMRLLWPDTDRLERCIGYDIDRLLRD